MQYGDPAAVATQISKMRAMGVGNVYLYQASAQIPPDLREQIESTVANAVCLGALGGDIANLLRRWGTYLTEADLVGMRRTRGHVDAVAGQRAQKSAVSGAFAAAVAAASATRPGQRLRARTGARYERPNRRRGTRWMDERITTIGRYEQAATAARDEAKALRSQAALLRRGQGREAAQRTRCGSAQSRGLARRRAGAAGDVRTQRMDARRNGSARRSQLLTQAPDALWRMYRERTGEHRAAQRAFILEHPAAVPDSRQRILWLSRLQLAEPMIEVAAYVERTVRQLAAAEGDAPAGRKVVSASAQSLATIETALAFVAYQPGPMTSARISKRSRQQPLRV